MKLRSRTSFVLATAAIVILSLTACNSADVADSSSADGGSDQEPTGTDTPAGGQPAMGAFDATGEEIAEALQRDDWWYPALFVDCDAADTDPVGCTGERIEGVYNAIPSSDVTQSWDICMVVPHFADPYWVAVNHGAVVEAERLGVRLQMLEAGGYTELATQVNQIDDCVARGADAVAIGAISFDGLDAKIDQLLADGLVVIDGLNGVSNPDVHGRALVDWHDMGAEAAAYLAGLDRQLDVAWFPGPPGAGWSEDANDGFHATLDGSQVTVIDTKFGDTGRQVQLSLVEDTLQAYDGVDVIAGTAVTAEVAAIDVDDSDANRAMIIADYIVPGVFDLIESGKVTCAVSDQPVMQARMAIDMAVRTLEGHGFDNYSRVGPAPRMVCGPAAGDDENLDTFLPETTFAPDGWSPIFNVG